MNHWLMKTEPDQFSIADLARKQIEPWSGVRNFMARNHMRAMAIGDAVLFYHSSCEPPGVAGLARVVHTGVVDETQFDPASPYFDPRAQRAAPRWDCVDVEYVSTFPELVSLERMRGEPVLSDMLVLKRGMRLSVQPVSAAHYQRIVQMSTEPAPPPLPKPPRKPKPKVTAKPKAKAKAKPKAKAKRKKR